MKRHSSQTQKGTPYGVGVHVEDRHSGGGRELSGKGDVRLQRPARGYLSSLVPGVATVSTSPHYTACYSALDVRHSLDLGCNVGPPSTKQG